MPAKSNSQLHHTWTWLPLAFAWALPAAAIAQLPPTAPTTQAAPIAATAVSASENLPRFRARVIYQDGLLTVEANNSSLTGILRDIVRATGMKMSGNAGEQRVFGNYGPAAPSVILATLLDGTGSNMLIRETADNGLAELVLTPRTGGPTPASPSMPDSDYDTQQYAGGAPSPPIIQNTSTQPLGVVYQQQPATSGPQPVPQPLNNVLGSPGNTTPTAGSIPTVQSISTDSLSTPSTAQPVSGIVDSTNPPPSGSTGFGSSTPTQPADNAAKTPEQIMQQLLSLQAARQAAQQNNTNQSTPATKTPPQ